MTRPHRGVFRVECCGRRRGVLPGGVLVCSRCDFSHVDGTTMPNEDQSKDVPLELRIWRAGDEA